MPFPTPQTGLVISYEYLWRNEAAASQEHRRKSRPCAVVLVLQRAETNMPTVAVVPITHSPPRNPDVAVEIPAAVKQFLGLDGERSWIILDDFNVFTWPGFDLRPVPGGKERYDFGLLPPKFFQMIITKFNELRQQRRVAPTMRDEE